MSERRKHTKTGALLAGGALLAWLLLRGGSGFGFGRKGGGAETSERRVRIRVAADGITADGAAVTLDEAVAIAHDAGGADLFATGAARQGTVDDLIAALRDAGVSLWIVGAGHA